MFKLLKLIILTLYCSLIFWLSSQPSLPVPMLFLHQDKIHHIGAYFIMGTLAWGLFNDYCSKSNYTLISSLVFCSLYGLSDEWHQSYVPGRDADILDWLADTIGAALALICITLTRHKMSITKKQNT